MISGNAKCLNKIFNWYKCGPKGDDGEIRQSEWPSDRMLECHMVEAARILIATQTLFDAGPCRRRTA